MKGIKTILALFAVVSAIVPHYAAQALRNITGKDFAKDPAKREEWWEKNK